MPSIEDIRIGSARLSLQREELFHLLMEYLACEEKDSFVLGLHRKGTLVFCRTATGHFLVLSLPIPQRHSLLVSRSGQRLLRSYGKISHFHLHSPIPKPVSVSRAGLYDKHQHALIAELLRYTHRQESLYLLSLPWEGQRSWSDLSALMDRLSESVLLAPGIGYTELRNSWSYYRLETDSGPVQLWLYAPRGLWNVWRYYQVHHFLRWADKVSSPFLYRLVRSCNAPFGMLSLSVQEWCRLPGGIATLSDSYLQRVSYEGERAFPDILQEISLSEQWRLRYEQVVQNSLGRSLLDHFCRSIQEGDVFLLPDYERIRCSDQPHHRTHVISVPLVPIALRVSLERESRLLFPILPEWYRDEAIGILPQWIADIFRGS